jgi:hypothetical protein
MTEVNTNTDECLTKAVEVAQIAKVGQANW